MRILYIHQYFSTPGGSVGTRSYEFAKRLVAVGHEVTILCGTSHLVSVEGSQSAGIRIIQIPISACNRDSLLKRTWAFLRFAWKASWKAVSTECDLVYATSTPLTVGVPALAAKYIRRRKMIFEVRDLWPELPKAMGIIRNPVALAFLGWFESLCYHGADACVGLSPGIVKGIQAKCPGKRVELIPNGCDLDIFGGRPVGGGFGAKEGDSAVTSFVAIFCGAHGRANGLDAVLDAAIVLKQKKREDISFVFVGDGQLKRKLKERAELNGLDACHFLDPMPKAQLAQLMGKVDLGLMILADIPAFRYGTSPNKFFDYIASGLPVLCNYPGWVADLLKEWNCGVTVPSGEPEAFADALVNLADNRSKLSDQGIHARALAKSEFDRESLFDRLASLIEEIMIRN